MLIYCKQIKTELRELHSDVNGRMASKVNLLRGMETENTGGNAETGAIGVGGGSNSKKGVGENNQEPTETNFNYCEFVPKSSGSQ